MAKGDEQECNFCLLDFDGPTLLNFDTAPATHQMVARNTPDGYSDIVFICKEYEKDYDDDALLWCEECGRLKRNRNRCFCRRLAKNKSTKPLSEETLIARSFSSRPENKIRELEKELYATKEELVIEREEVAKFHEKSKEWGEEKIKRIKELEAEVSRLTQENKRLKDKQSGQLVAQIEVKKWPWSKIRK